ncbi:hypothetical protein C9I50_13575 [Pseudomonas prosekii]|nr:hypothetical protein C9I50_13575 [Pseudomonas prosekii]
MRGSRRGSGLYPDCLARARPKLPDTNPVGASLLAKAVCQPTSLLDDQSPSRAGSRPHVRRGIG